MRWLTPADYEFYGFWGPESDGRKAVEDHKFLLEERRAKYKNTLIDKDNEHVKILKERGWVVISNFFTEKEKEKLLTIKASMEKHIQKGNVKNLKSNIIHLIRDPLSNIEKITHVYIEITIAEPSSMVSRSSDTYITAKVKAKIFADKILSGLVIKIVTEKGIVYLMGLVTQEEAEIATNIARETGGVQKVVKLFKYID